MKMYGENSAPKIFGLVSSYSSGATRIVVSLLCLTLLIWRFVIGYQYEFY